MKQKIMIKYLIVFIGMLLVYNLLFNNSYAVTAGTVYLSSNKSALEKGEEVEIFVNIKNSKTAAFNFNMYFDDTKLEFVSGPENINVVGNRVVYVWYDNTGGKNAKEGKLETLKFKAKEDGLANVQIDGEFYNEVGQQIQTDFKGIQVQIEKKENVATIEEVIETENSELSNTNLETLAIENVLLYPPFDNSVSQYKADVGNGVSSLNILAIPENENASAEVMGKDDLKEGENNVRIIVTAQDGVTKREYEVAVYKRNLEEEEKYQNEQKENQAKLEAIYQAQKTSGFSNNTEESIEEAEKNEEKSVSIGIIVIVVGAILVIFVIVKYGVKNSSKNK
ncbi:MAG: cadherin-like beta sandwich domain-containing protein [Clostridia bacterium]|nr:cadherin-like beta sandwich domain-containing protein [Clostridia bacterium]